MRGGLDQQAVAFVRAPAAMLFLIGAPSFASCVGKCGLPYNQSLVIYPIGPGQIRQPTSVAGSQGSALAARSCQVNVE
jgi:hypothetical protein